MSEGPVLKVAKGNPTSEELAALIAVVAMRAAVPAPTPATGRASNWAAYWRNARTPFRPGPGQWRASAHP